MILVCSRGHKFDTNDSQDSFYHPYVKDGTRCPMLMSYDRMSGSEYCRRILHEDGKKRVRVVRR